MRISSNWVQNSVYLIGGNVAPFARQELNHERFGWPKLAEKTKTAQQQ